MNDKTIHEEETIREGIPLEGNSEKVPFKNFKDYSTVETLVSAVNLLSIIPFCFFVALLYLLDFLFEATTNFHLDF